MKGHALQVGAAQDVFFYAAGALLKLAADFGEKGLGAGVVAGVQDPVAAPVDEEVFAGADEGVGV